MLQMMDHVRFNLVIVCVATTLCAATRMGSLTKVDDVGYLPAPTRAEYLMHGPPATAGSINDSHPELYSELAEAGLSRATDQTVR